MPTTNTSGRKKQTRLTFTSLPSSSPTASTLPHQIRGRAAAIRYHDPSTPSKRRRVQRSQHDKLTRTPASNEGPHLPFQPSNFGNNSRRLDMAFPTPAPSSQLESELVKTAARSEATFSDSESSVSSDIRRSDTTMTSIPQRTAAAPATLRSPHTPAAGTRYQSRVAYPKRMVKSSSKVSSKEGEVGQTHQFSTRQRPRVVFSSDSDSDVLDDASSRHKTVLRSGRTLKSASDGRRLTGSEQSKQALHREQEPDDPWGTPSSAHKLGVLDKNHLHTTLSGTSRQSRSSKPETVLLMKSALKGNVVLTRKVDMFSRASLTEEKNDQPSDETSDEISPIGSSRKLSSRVSAGGKELARQSYTIELSSNDDDLSDDPIVSPIRRKRYKPTTPTRQHTEQIANRIRSDDGSDQDSISSPIQKNLSRRLAAHMKSVDTGESGPEVADELKDELHDLKDTEICETRTRARNSTSTTTAAQRRLEAIRKRRAGEAVHDSELGLEEPLGTEDAESGTDPRTGETRKTSEDSDMEIIRPSLLSEADEYDDEFLDDADETLGAPLGLEEMPLEFTRHAHKKPLEHFKDAVEWMIHKKINPAFPRNDPVYLVAFRKLDDVVKGYAGSKFLSAAWNSRFLAALKARPNFAVIEIPVVSAILEGTGCEACNKRNHPGKYQITLSGRAYHHESLEPVSDGEDEDAESTQHSRGFRPSDKDINFSVGRFCKSNAATAHALLHWRYHLNEWVVDWLESQQYLTPEKIVQREKWSTRRRGDLANEIVDFMEETGEIKALHRDFKINMRSAEDAKPYVQRDQLDD